MSNAKPYLFGAVLGASAMYVALQYHVVHSHDGFQMVPRTPQHSVGLAYADVRNWSPSQWTDRPELARALMAHGSSDLISESVASSLADSVTEENSTLDQLRSFLDKSRQDGANGTAAGLLEIPSSTPKPSNLNPGADDDLTRIPFPQDAKKEVVADPFRVAQGSEAAPVAAQTTPRPVGTSRFSAADVIDGLREDANGHVDSFSAAVPRPATMTDAAVTSSTGARTTSQQAQAMEDRIFGGSGSSSDAAAPVVNSSSNSSNESMFEEVSTQLENRAQAALNRAKEAASTKAGSVVSEAAVSTDGYLRQQIQQTAPDAVKSIIKSGTTGNSPQSPNSLLNQFDPFLE